MPQLFERFHRDRRRPRPSFEGSGIGLALVRELVRLHGGEIQVESKLGHGSAFTVALPFGAAHLPAERVRAEGRTSTPAPARAQGYVEEARRWLQDEPGVDPLPVLSATEDLPSSLPPARAGRPEWGTRAAGGR